MNLNNNESMNIAENNIEHPQAELVNVPSVQYVYKHKQRNELTAWRYQDGKYQKNQLIQSIKENIMH